MSGVTVRGRLDSIDWAILKELQADGSITNVELARRVGLSAPPCLRRVRALESAGIIKAYRAILDPKNLGFEIVCFAMVQLDIQGKKELREFEQRVKDWSMVRECWTLSGDIARPHQGRSTGADRGRSGSRGLRGRPSVRACLPLAESELDPSLGQSPKKAASRDGSSIPLCSSSRMPQAIRLPAAGRGKACCHAGNFRRSALAPSDVITGLVPVIPMV
jgi:DNA-binding Lrp family transcriptional regulator